MNILLVEDDLGIGRFVSRGLNAEGFRVCWLRSGEEVAAALAAARFAAIILDLGLPDVDGLELCARLRRDGVALPVLMLTARDSLDDKLDGFRNGADDYLSKPFAFEELVARLRVLARRGAQQGPRLRVGALTLDMVSRIASVGETAVELPGRELAVLACLMRDAGRTMSRQAIIEQAWGEGAEVTDNTIDVYVGYLRRRLADLDGAPRIKTVRGEGFQLTPPR
jgi:DNA-binding response OmpR family regulator